MSIFGKYVLVFVFTLSLVDEAGLELVVADEVELEDTSTCVVPFSFAIVL
jgi:hypothetical protein